MLCCTECRVLLTASTGLVHIRSAAHAVSYARMSEDKYENVCTELGIRTEYPTIQELNGIESLSGLDIYTMSLVCGVEECSMIFASRSTMWKHYNGKHKGVPLLNIWHIVLAQHLDNGAHKTYFQVIKPLYVFRPILNKDWIDNAIKLSPLYNTDPRYVNTFLVKTKWVEHVKGLDPDELRSLVSSPRANEFPLLKEMVEWVFEVAMVLIKGTPEIILQHLNTKELVK